MKHFTIRTLKQTEALSIASIHATILSIFVAVFFTYGTYVNSSLRDQKEAILQEAKKAGNVVTVWGISLQVGNQEACSATASRSWQARMRDLKQIVVSDMNHLERGNQIFCILYKLQSEYPWIVNDAAMAARAGLGRFEFQDFEQVNNWVRDVNSVCDQIHDNKPRIAQALTPFYASVDWGKQANDVINNIYKKSDQIHDFAHHIQDRIIVTNRYRFALTQSPAALLVIIITSAVVFALSVALPMMRREISTVWIVWVPLIYYACLFIYLGYCSVMMQT